MRRSFGAALPGRDDLVRLERVWDPGSGGRHSTIGDLVVWWAELRSVRGSRKMARMALLTRDQKR